MKRNRLVIVLVILSVAASVTIGAAIMTRRNQSATSSTQRKPVATQTQTSGQGTSATAEARVPAYFKTPPSVSSLPPLLPPENFTGQTRDAYKAVAEIPQTIAQLPCYCYCDEEHGHKSLHSCFESDHAASCGVCMREALVAYKLEKEQRLTAPQIRERIIAMFGPKG